MFSLSKGDLRAHRECVEPGAGISAVGWADLLGDVPVKVVKHEAYVGVDVPVQRQGVDCLPAAGDAVCRTQLVVQIDRAEASRNLERSPAPPVRENGLTGMTPL